MSNALSIFNQLRPVTVGYDNIFDHFEKMFEDDFFKSPSVNYPPYNIVKTGENQYNVEVALAGYNKKDISIEYADNLLTIKSVKDNSFAFFKDKFEKLNDDNPSNPKILGETKKTTSSTILASNN